MSKAAEVITTVYLVGFLVCFIISVPMTVWAIIQEERETQIETEHKIRGTIATAAAFSLVWVVMIPFYLLILLEKIAGKGGDE